MSIRRWLNDKEVTSEPVAVASARTIECIISHGKVQCRFTLCPVPAYIRARAAGKCDASTNGHIRHCGQSRFPTSYAKPSPGSWILSIQTVIAGTNKSRKNILISQGGSPRGEDASCVKKKCQKGSQEAKIRVLPRFERGASRMSPK